MNDNPEGIRGIVAFDLDGTILRGQTVCELLAEPIGRLEEMRRLEAFTDETDIIGGRQRMAEWYSDYSLQELEAFLNEARWAPGAHEAIHASESGRIRPSVRRGGTPCQRQP